MLSNLEVLLDVLWYFQASLWTTRSEKKKKPDRLAPILPQRILIVYMYRNFDSKKVVLFIIYINIQ